MSGGDSICMLFDLDGTIFDSLPGIEFSVRAAFAACGLPLKHENLREAIGPPIRTILATAGEVEGEPLDDLARAFRKSYDDEGWRRTECFPNAVPVLRELRRLDYRLFVVSNKPRHISIQILAAEGIADLFEEIVTKDSRAPAYPSKDEMVATLLARHKIDPQFALLVGDTIEDAKAAETAGIRFAFMTHGYGQVTESDSVPVAFRLESFLQIPPLLKREFIRD